MKRDNELQKPVAYTSIWLGKMESDQKLKVYDAQKAKGQLIKVKYQKFQVSISKWDVLIQKDQMICQTWSQMKSSKDIGLKFMWEAIYAFFYNWDGSHYLVLVVYALIELIIEISH